MGEEVKRPCRISAWKIRKYPHRHANENENRRHGPHDDGQGDEKV